jgi:signal transduction histidine kinase
MDVAEQRTLLAVEANEFSPNIKPVLPRKILAAIEGTFVHYGTIQNKKLTIVEPVFENTIETDKAILERILTNMTKNAFEGTEGDDSVLIGCKPLLDGRVRFYVWNKGFIPDDVAKRVFRRYFSTKAASGRGLGTYSMKVFGEQVLGGHVSLNTSQQEGTTFFIDLPISDVQ